MTLWKKAFLRRAWRTICASAYNDFKLRPLYVYSRYRLYCSSTMVYSRRLKPFAYAAFLPFYTSCGYISNIFSGCMSL